MITHSLSRAEQDLIDSISRNMGSGLMDLFQNPDLIEIMLNPDGSVFYEILGEPMEYWGHLEASRSRLIINYVASYHDRIVGDDGVGESKLRNPYLECEFPVDGSRFTATLPPITPYPSFSLRKKASRIFTLDDYVQSGIMTDYQAATLRKAVTDHKNILIIGGTGSGKTTLINAVIHEISTQFPKERLVIIEDTNEIQCTSKNKVQFKTTVHVTMTDLLKLSLRYYPKRILVGEVRDGSALDLLDAWNTGHEGGLATLHSNNVESALTRLYGLISRNVSAPKGEHAFMAIGDAVDYIVSINKTKGGERRVEEILRVEKYCTEKGNYITSKV